MIWILLILLIYSLSHGNCRLIRKLIGHWTHRRLIKSSRLNMYKWLWTMRHALLLLSYLSTLNLALGIISNINVIWVVKVICFIDFLLPVIIIDCIIILLLYLLLSYISLRTSFTNVSFWKLLYHSLMWSIISLDIIIIEWLINLFYSSSAYWDLTYVPLTRCFLNYSSSIMLSWCVIRCSFNSCCLLSALYTWSMVRWLDSKIRWCHYVWFIALFSTL